MRLACGRWRLAIANFPKFECILRIVPLRKKPVAAGRRNLHARRVRSPEHLHSARKVIIGSTCEARRAGIQQAAAAESDKTTATRR